MQFTSLLLLFSLLATSANALDEVENFGSNPGNCEMYVYEPTSLKKDQNSPLLVAIHGCNESANKLSKQAGWNDLADRYRFRILYPQTKYTNNGQRCWNWFNAGDTYDGQGELGSIREMIAYMMKNYAISDEEVFIYGVSSGGAMTSAAMANYPELFQAGCVYAGGPFGVASSPMRAMKTMANPDDRSSEDLAASVLKQSGEDVTHYPRVVVVHGTRDPIVDSKNGELVCKQWAALHSMEEKHLRSSLVNNREDLVLMEYSGVTGEVLVSHLEIKKMMHAIAIDPGDGPEQGGKRSIFSLDYDFHSSLWIARQMGLIKK
jgi:poly(hydroxyalkanoate) depolymerase family esterase